MCKLFKTRKPKNKSKGATSLMHAFVLNGSHSEDNKVNTNVNPVEEEINYQFKHKGEIISFSVNVKISDITLSNKD